MKPKQQIDINAVGEEAAKLLLEDSTASAALKDMRSTNAARKEQLKKMLTVVWEALESGVSVNGFTKKEDWAAGFAKTSVRTCQYIVNGRKSRANQGSRPAVVDLKDGMLVRMNGGNIYRVTSFGVGKDDDETSIELFVEEYEEPLPNKKSPAATPSKPQTKLNRRQTFAAVKERKLAHSTEPESLWDVPTREAWLKILQSMRDEGIYLKGTLQKLIKNEKFFLKQARREERLDQIEAEGQVTFVVKPVDAERAKKFKQAETEMLAQYGICSEETE